MRNPNYIYVQDPKGGWEIILNQVVVWGRTKAAARSRMLRKLRREAKLTANQANQEEVNDQS